MEINLIGQQVTAYDAIMVWASNPSAESPQFVLAGYAGTGKSTLAGKIAANLGNANVAYCAYTGKAANVLREKGCLNVNTIHGWLYDIKGHNKAVMAHLQAELEAAILNQDTVAQAQLRKDIEAKQAEFKKPKFTLNKDSELRHYDLVIVDEYSMLPAKIVEDLLTVCKKVLFLGDPYQLPPVSGTCPLQPEVFLEEIHRQALESGIIRMSKAVREGQYIQPGRTGNDFWFLRKAQLSPEKYLNCDQVIVGRNNTRHAMNSWFRKQYDYLTPLPAAGEKLICLKNNHYIGLFNGMIGQARNHAKNCGQYYFLDFENMDTLRVWADDCRGNESTYSHDNEMHKQLERFTYAYAITCHKSQGSEFDNVIVINEPIGRNEDRRRWVYTSITRAKKNCVLVNPKE